MEDEVVRLSRSVLVLSRAPTCPAPLWPVFRPFL